MAITRRVFLKGGALAVVGTSVIPSFLTRAVSAAETAGATAGKKRLVVLFQRGAADGLNIVVPHGEQAYYSMRPSIAIPRPRGNEGAIDLDGLFGLHPSMTAFKPLWDSGHLAIVHAAGSPDNTRSHFDAQDYMESGTPGLKATEDGWLNRALVGLDETKPSPFRAVSMGGALPRTLAGPAPAVAMSDIRGFAVGGRGPGGQAASSTFACMYEHDTYTLANVKVHAKHDDVARLVVHNCRMS